MTSETPIRTILVVGSGTMGWGIFRSFARPPFAALMLSRNPKLLPPLPAGTRAFQALPATAPDLIIECIPEKLELKAELFRRIGQAYGAAPIVASNTSGLPLEDLATAYGHPQKFLGMHYFQPAEAFPLVEVIRIPQTDDRAVESVVAALADAGKEALRINRPIQGFLINRLQHAILHEAYYLIEQGIVTAADVDKVARQLLGPRMCITGLIEQKDIGGLETHALAQRAIIPYLWHGSEPCRLVQDKYARGDLGLESGRGFYDWSDKDPAQVRKIAGRRLAQLLAFLENL